MANQEALDGSFLIRQLISGLSSWLEIRRRRQVLRAKKYKKCKKCKKFKRHQRRQMHNRRKMAKSPKSTKSDRAAQESRVFWHHNPPAPELRHEKLSAADCCQSCVKLLCCRRSGSRLPA